VNETKDVGLGTVFGKSRDDGGVGSKVAWTRALKGTGFDIEDIDKEANRREDVGFLGCEIRFCEGVLSAIIDCISRRTETGEGEQQMSVDKPSTVPQVEHKVSQEFDGAMFDINGSAEAAHVFSNIVAEDDATHRRFARATFAHQEDLFPLWLLESVHGLRRI